MTNDTLSTPEAGGSGHGYRHDRQWLDVAAVRRAYERIAEWESERHVLRNQLVPMIIWVSFWLMVMSWIAGWELNDIPASQVPVQTQTEAQALPGTLGCR